MTVLAVGIGLLTGLSWAVNGLLADRSTAGQIGPPAGTSAAGSAPAHASTEPALPTPAPSPSASPSPSPVPPRHRTRARSHASGRALPCAAGAVTLSVTSPQYWYQTGKTPQFAVHAVADGQQPCRFNMGPRFVSVVVTTAGRPLWNSADCVTGSGSDMTVLTGKPAVLRVSWNRQTSSPGCGPSHLVRPGEYKVTAVAGQLHSARVNIVLGAKGAIGP